MQNNRLPPSKTWAPKILILHWLWEYVTMSRIITVTNLSLCSAVQNPFSNLDCCIIYNNTTFCVPYITSSFCYLSPRMTIWNIYAWRLLLLLNIFITLFWKIKIFIFIVSRLYFAFSLLLRLECCSFSNGEYVKAGLAELEHWVL